VKTKSRKYFSAIVVTCFVLLLYQANTKVISSANQLAQIPQNPLVDSIMKVEKSDVLKRAAELLNENPVTVTSNFCPRSAGTVHDYYSEGTYWWPDPANPNGPYIRKDGMNNPENFDKHIIAIERFSWIVGTETSAYLLTGDEKYAKAALKHLNAWFVDTTTLMNPNLLYSQAIKGVCTGRGIGIIDAVHLIDVAQSVKILSKSPYMTLETQFKITNWFSNFLTWLTTHQYGIDEMNSKNNHGTWWYAQVAAYASLVGNQEILQKCTNAYLEILLPKQLGTDGGFPLELERTKPYAYSLFNLDGFATLAWILSDKNHDVWNMNLPDGKGMKKAVEFMIPFIQDKSIWKYPKDVLHWDEQPNRQPFMFFAALSQNSMELFKLWKSVKQVFKSDESRRNFPIKNPLLWIGIFNPLADKTYTNPIIKGFNPDPSICRVGEDYYLATSSFEYFPGVPIYHSKDLINWELIGHALHQPSQLNLDSIECSGGIYAPTLRFNKGIYYMITTLVGSKQSNHRNFIVTAKNPSGPWSEPHWIEDAPGIDPSLFFDDDGKVYYSGNISPQVKVWEKHRNIYIQELDVKTWKLIGKREEVLDGSLYYKKGTLDGGIESGVNNFEASHIYKKDGKYYLLIAHGGTSQNHAVSIWRSNNIFGPYEINPANPILTHRDLSKHLYFTSTGHADLVQTQNGDWWMVYLAKRPYGGENHILGRETFISPVDWKGVWPVVNPNGNIGRGEAVHFNPALKQQKSKNIETLDNFNSKTLNLNWNFIRTPRSLWWSLSERKGFLRMKLQKTNISNLANPSFIGRRQEDMNFLATAKMEFKPLSSDDEAGLVIERDRNFYIKFTVKKLNNQLMICLAQKNGVPKTDSLIASNSVDSGNLFLKVIADGVFYSFSYSSNGTDWKWLAQNVDCRLLGLAGSGRFTGTFIGMYASANGKESGNYVDFDWFEYLPNL